MEGLVVGYHRVKRCGLCQFLRAVAQIVWEKEIRRLSADFLTIDRGGGAF